MAINMGQIKLDTNVPSKDTIDASVDTSNYFRPQAILGHNLEKEMQKIEIHKEILRVSLEELNV